MSQFVRQLHVLNNIKTGLDSAEILSTRKGLPPVSSWTSLARPFHTKTLNKNLQLKTEDIEDSSSTASGGGKKKKNLAIILSWLMAKEPHLDKYSRLYLQRGFDVLTVRVHPKQLLLPVGGIQVVATNVLDYVDSNKQYENIIIHGFSIGAYLMGEMFVKMAETHGKYADFPSRISGVIFDSAVDVPGLPAGLSRSLTSNTLVIKALEKCLETHLALMHNVATKHYVKASKFFHNTPLKCPALLLVSEADKIGPPESSMAVADKWRSKGVYVSLKCWKDTFHVSHMRNHEKEYVQEIDNFLGKLNLSNNNNGESVNNNLQLVRSRV